MIHPAGCYSFLLALVVAKPRARCRAPSFIQQPILDHLDEVGRPAGFQKTSMAIEVWTGWTGWTVLLYSSLKKDRKRERDMRSLHSADRRRCWSTVRIK